MLLLAVEDEHEEDSKLGCEVPHIDLSSEDADVRERGITPESTNVSQKEIRTLVCGEVSPTVVHVPDHDIAFALSPIERLSRS